MQRLALTLIFIVANLFSQVVVAYDCAYRDGGPTRTCCCMQGMSGQMPCLDSDRCGEMPDSTNGPCCQQVLVSGDIGGSVGVAAIAQNPLDAPQWIATEIAFWSPPVDSSFLSPYAEADIPWLFGALTYLKTSRFRI